MQIIFMTLCYDHKGEESGARLIVEYDNATYIHSKMLPASFKCKLAP